MFARSVWKSLGAGRCPPFVGRMLAVQCRVLVSRRSTKGSKTRRECQSRRRGWRGKARGVIPLKESRGEPRRWAWRRTGERRRKGEKILPPPSWLSEGGIRFFFFNKTTTENCYRCWRYFYWRFYHQFNSKLIQLRIRILERKMIFGCANNNCSVIIVKINYGRIFWTLNASLALDNYNFQLFALNFIEIRSL